MQRGDKREKNRKKYQIHSSHSHSTLSQRERVLIIQYNTRAATVWQTNESNN